MAELSASFFDDEPVAAPQSAAKSGDFFGGIASTADGSPPVAPSKSGLKLTEEDRLLINSLAAFQLRYGKTNEAIALLQVVNRLWPEDVQTLRLLTQALLLAEDYEAAEMTEQALERANSLSRPTRADFLRRAILHHGLKRFDEARRAISDFLRLSKGK